MLNRENIKGDMKHSSVPFAASSRHEDYSKIIYLDGKSYVNARALHTFLESKKLFQSWFKSRVLQWDFIENSDYFAIPNGIAKQGGHNRRDFLVSLDMAKELGMLERTKKGKAVRLYYIALEKRLQNQHPYLENCRVHDVDGKPYYFFKDVMRTLGYKTYGLSWRKASYPQHFLHHPSGYFISEEYAGLLSFSRGIIERREQVKSVVSTQLTLELN